MLEQLERREGRRHIDDRPTNDPPGMHMALHIQHMMGPSPPQSELNSDEEQMANEAQHLAEDDDWANDELVDALNPLLNDSEMKHLEELLSD